LTGQSLFVSLAKSLNAVIYDHFALCIQSRIIPTTQYTELLPRSQVDDAIVCHAEVEAVLFLNINVELRPPLGGIADGAGGFAQDERAALFGNDGEQRLTPLDKAILWDECP
jgi:hypothetical protein